MPAFEARTIQHADGPVGVVRVYESADTPHVALRTGSVFVREVAGDADLASARRPAAHAHGERVYISTQIRSRAQLLELSARGRAANQRVQALLDPANPLPLTNHGLGLRFENLGGEQGFQPFGHDRSLVVARLLPYTLPARYRSWVTTAEGSAAVLRAGEELANVRGLSSNWLTPHPNGVSIAIERQGHALHRDAGGQSLSAEARLTLDETGVTGAALLLAGPDNEMRRERVHINDFAESFVIRVIDAALRPLMDGEFLGRARCRIDLIGLPQALLLADEGNKAAADWVYTDADLSLPASPEHVRDVARLAANAYARSARIPAWDNPASVS